MTKSVWFKFYSSDWLAGTSGLTAAERGVYITILALIYEEGGPVSMDRARLARRCGVPAGSFKRILASLLEQGKLVETPDGITNKRAEIELGEREIALTKLQFGAQKTNAILAEKRSKTKGAPDAERDAERTPRALAREPEPEPDNIHNTTLTRAREATAEIVAIPGGRNLDIDGLVANLGDLCARANGGNLPTGWAGAETGIIIGHWLNSLGLTPGEVLTVADRQLRHWGKPPYGPKSWDSAMAKFAAAKAAPPPTIPEPRPARHEPESYAARRLRELRGTPND